VNVEFSGIGLRDEVVQFHEHLQHLSQLLDRHRLQLTLQSQRDADHLYELVFMKVQSASPDTLQVLCGDLAEACCPQA
jgi:hypothetical protein